MVNKCHDNDCFVTIIAAAEVTTDVVVGVRQSGADGRLTFQSSIYKDGAVIIHSIQQYQVTAVSFTACVRACVRACVSAFEHACIFAG